MVYTHPQIAHVGFYERQLTMIPHTQHLKLYNSLDRAICDGEKGMIKLLVKNGSNQILGATIVGGPASDMISQITMAMEHKIDMGSVGGAVSMYPSYADAIKSFSDTVMRANFPKFVSQVKKLRIF